MCQSGVDLLPLPQCMEPQFFPTTKISFWESLCTFIDFIPSIYFKLTCTSLSKKLQYYFTSSSPFCDFQSCFTLAPPSKSCKSLKVEITWMHHNGTTKQNTPILHWYHYVLETTLDRHKLHCRKMIEVRQVSCSEPECY